MPTLKPHKEILLDIVFEASKFSIPYADLHVGEPRVNDDPERVGDTAVTITSLIPKKYTGSVVATFDKIDLEWIFATYLGIEHLSLQTRANSVHDLIPALQINYGMNVTEVDLIDDPITWEDNEAIVAMRASPDSMYYKGGILTEVIRPQLIGLSEIIQVTRLGGLNYPTTA